MLSQANTDIIQLAKGKRGYLRDTGSSAQAQPRGLQRVSRHRSVETGKANHSDPYTQLPRGGCIRIWRLIRIVFGKELFD